MIYEFMPSQSYNGYDKPWAGGAGINLFDEDSPDIESGRIGSTGNIISSQYTSTSGFIPISPSTSYYGKNTAGTAAAYAFNWYDSEKSFISQSGINGSGPQNGSKTSPATAAYIRFTVYTSALGTHQCALNKPSSDHNWYPYENACPPEGFNIWDPVEQEMSQVYAGYVNDVTRELYLRPVYQEYAGEELVGPWMSSLELYDEDTTPTEGAFVIDFGGELTSYEITDYMLQTLLDSLGIRRFFHSGASLLNSLMDQAQGRVRSEEELLHLSRPIRVIAIGDQLPAGLTFKPISKDVLSGLPGKFIR